MDLGMEEKNEVDRSVFERSNGRARQCLYVDKTKAMCARQGGGLDRDPIID